MTGLNVKFTPDDFLFDIEDSDAGLKYLAHVASHMANAKLQEWLDKAPEVYANRHCAPMRQDGHLRADWHECTNTVVNGLRECGHTHTARLVCIEEIGK